MATEFEPIEQAPTGDEIRQNYLRRRTEVDPSLPDFSHLLRYPESHGPYLGMQDLLETSIDRFLTSSRTQVITVLGHHASGKTSNIKLAIDYIERRSEGLGSTIMPTFVAYDSTIEATRQVKDSMRKSIVFPTLKEFESKRKPGNRNTKFYKATNYVFNKAIKTAIEQRGIIIVEAPAIGGVIGDRERMGKDRGTTAIRTLASGEGYNDMEYDLTVVALVAGPNLLFENFRKRKSESAEYVAKRPGSTAKGTEIANRELSRLLKNLKLIGDPSMASFADVTNALATRFFPWELYQYLDLPTHKTAILKNTHADVPTVTKEELAPYNLFGRLSEDQMIEWLLNLNDQHLFYK